MEKAPTIVQLVVLQETGDSQYRMRWPAEHLARQEPSWRVVNLDAGAAERFHWAEEADLLVLFQSNDIALLSILERRRERGKKTLVEYNDNFYSPPHASPAAEAWRSPQLWDIYERFMSEADGVIVTGPGLADLFAEHTDTPIHILENHFPFEPEDFSAYWEAPTEQLNLAWAGSLGHIADILAVAPVLNDVLQAHPNVHLHIMGNAALPQELAIESDRFHYHPWGSMADYLNFWKQMHIGIAPLLGTAYNRCRSDIKAVEMSAMATYPLLTEELPYKNFLNTLGIKSFSDLTTLREQLEWCLNHLSEIEVGAKKCYEYVVSERLSGKRDERAKLYEQHLPDKENLSAFAWPMEIGYHEINCESATPSQLERLVKDLKRQIMEGRGTVVEVELQHALREHPHYPDLALLHLSCLERSNSSELGQFAKKYVEQFPHDLRFQLFALSLTHNEEELLRGWTALCKELATAAAPLRTHYCDRLTDTFVMQCETTPILISFSERLLQIYPESVQLRFFLAKYNERSGNADVALEHYEWLARAIRVQRENTEFISKIDPSYINTWCEALRTRTSGKFSDEQ